MNGLSTNRRCIQAASCLRQGGADFVIRYYSETTRQPEKRLTPAEAKAIDQAGMRIAVVYQDRQTEVGDFSRQSGERDGKFAFQYAREIGQPYGTTIFFAVDYDAETSHLSSIQSYFRGVAKGLADASGKADAYPLGVYGSGLVCSRLKKAGLVKHTWLSESTGHSGSSTYEDWNVKQMVTNQSRCGLPAKSWQRCVSQGADRSWSFRLGGKAPDAELVSGVRDLPLLKRGASGESVVVLQKYLNRWLLSEGSGLLVEDGDFGKVTENGVKAFQASHVDDFGLALRVDGEVGGLTWSALARVTSGKPDPKPLALVVPGGDQKWWKSMPDESFGGSARGLAALRVAVAEAVAGRGESGGNNMGKDVEKYLNGIVSAPANWCAGFVSWCLSQSGPMPFDYTVGARSILSRAKAAGLKTYMSPTETTPLPGDIVVWWRVKLSSWEGHVGYVHHVEGGRIYTIEGNKTSRVEGFSYPLASMDRLLGFVRL